MHKIMIGENNCQIEIVIDILIHKIDSLQDDDLNNDEYHQASVKLREAKLWLNERTRQRIRNNEEGSDEWHE